MPNQLVLPITPGSLPSGFCPSTEQERLNRYMAVSSVIFPSTFSGVISSQTKPSDTSKMWAQLDQFGRFIRFYNFANGVWVSRHPMLPNMAIPWFNALPSPLNTYDGGDGNTLSDTSGPMWEVVTEMAAKFPLAAGTLPSSLVINQGSTGGEEKHLLVDSEVPSPSDHIHTVGRFSNDSNDDGFFLIGSSNVSGNAKSITGDQDSDNRQNLNQQSGPYIITSGVSTQNAPAVLPHQNMPPYFGMNWLRRTQRLFYTVS